MLMVAHPLASDPSTLSPFLSAAVGAGSTFVGAVILVFLTYFFATRREHDKWKREHRADAYDAAIRITYLEDKDRRKKAANEILPQLRLFGGVEVVALFAAIHYVDEPIDGLKMRDERGKDLGARMMEAMQRDLRTQWTKREKRLARRRHTM